IASPCIGRRHSPRTSTSATCAGPASRTMRRPSPPDPMASAPDSKLSAQVAAQIEDSIHVNAWPANHCLGAEEHLSARFGASRAVIREAIAIAEWNGSVERRRGREGGVFVTTFSPNAAVGMLRNFLFLAGADLAGLLRARRLVEGAI